MRSVGVAVAVLAAAGAARAEEQDAGRLRLGEGYCQYILGSTAAEANRLLVPQLFAGAGVFNVGENVFGELEGTHRGRVQAGLEYSVSDFWRGLAMRQKAKAECARYQSEQDLQAAIENGAQFGALAALKARADELARALPEGEQLLAGLQDDVRETRATVEELNIAQLRLDGLRQLATQTKIDYETAAAKAQPRSGKTLSVLLAAYRAADDRVEDWAGSVRSTQLWDLKLRGGYDQIIGIHEKTPLFGTATLTVSLASLFQHRANSEAREGRRISLENDVGTTGRKIAELAATLKATYQAENARLQELGMLLGDLEGQYQQVKALQTSLVRRYQDYLWFEIARMRAERAYLTEHTQQLKAFLGAEK